MDNTYIKLFRCSLDNELFNEKPFDRWRAFEYMMLKAYRFPKDEIIKGQVVHIGVGQFIISQRELAEKYGWSVNKLRRYQELLEKLKMATFDGNTYGNSIGTLITIENYAKYQIGESGSGNTNEHTGGNSDGYTDGYNIKKDKKVKNNINNNNIPPTIEEVRAYCLKRENRVNPEQFIDYYASKGWFIGKNKMKDWKAAVRTWERRNHEHKDSDKFKNQKFGEYL